MGKTITEKHVAEHAEQAAIDAIAKALESLPEIKAVKNSPQVAMKIAQSFAGNDFVSAKIERNMLNMNTQILITLDGILP